MSFDFNWGPDLHILYMLETMLTYNNVTLSAKHTGLLFLFIDQLLE